MQKKITKATFKSFIKKNLDNLYLKTKSSFNPMCDGVEYMGKADFLKADLAKSYSENNCGIEGVWLVGSSGNSFELFDSELFEGIEVYNCCGSFILAKPKFFSACNQNASLESIKNKKIASI